MRGGNRTGRLVAFLVVGAVVAILAAGGAYVLGQRAGEAKFHHISGFAWDRDEWARRTKGIRTSL